MEKNATRSLRIDADLADAERRDHAELGRMDALARTEHDLARLQVLAGEAAVLSGLASPRRRRCARRPRLRSSRSCMTTVSAPCGMTPPVKMRTHSRGPIEPDHGLPANDSPTRFSTVSRVGAQIGEAHRVAVHGRVVVARHGERRDDVFRQHAAERAAHVDALDRAHRREEAADQLARLGHRHRIRIVVVGAGSFAQGLRWAAATFALLLRSDADLPELVDGVDVAKRVRPRRRTRPRRS